MINSPNHTKNKNW